MVKEKVTITLTEKHLKALAEVHREYGVSRSGQIQTLIAKYLAKEYNLIPLGPLEQLYEEKGEATRG